MSYYTAKASKVIDAPADQIYAVISDYHEGHPAILPTRYFTDMTVIQGGQGEGDQRECSPSPSLQRA